MTYTSTLGLQENKHFFVVIAIKPDRGKMLFPGFKARTGIIAFYEVICDFSPRDEKCFCLPGLEVSVKRRKISILLTKISILSLFFNLLQGAE